MILPSSPVGTAVVGGSLFAGVATLVLVAYLARHRGKPGADWFIITLAAQALWCFAYGFALLVVDPMARRFLEGVAWVGILWTGPLFFAFSLDYTGRGDIVRSWLFSLVFVVPAVTTALALAMSPYGLLWSNFDITSEFGLAIATYTIQPWGFLVVLGGTGCAAAGVLILIETVFNYGPLYRREATAVALSTLAPSTALLLWLFRTGSVPYLNLAPVCFIAHAALDGYAFVGSRMFETNPTTRRAAERSVIDDIASPILILDPKHRIVEVNDAAASTFEIDTEAVLGTPVADIVPVTVSDDADQYTVVTEAGGRRREFTVAVSPLTDPAGTAVGHTVVLQDITDQLQREQRLSVLNRILRHNLRNEMNVIVGQADLINHASEQAQVRDSAELVRERGQKLLSIGEKAYDFERLRGTDPSSERVDLADLVREIATDLRRRFPDAVVETETGTTTLARTDREILTLVLSNLAENAIEHNDAPTPRVTLSVHRGETGEAPVIDVSDNGPGIDPSELTPVEMGQETDLEHTTGIGLWVVSWGVTELGGDVTFIETDGGTTVSVRLPPGAMAGVDAQQGQQHNEWPGL